MPSNAYSVHLQEMLLDPSELLDACDALRTVVPARRSRLAALCRATVVLSVSAWESYVEELVAESLILLRPPTPPLGAWPSFNATARTLLGRFNNPNAGNVETLLNQSLGLPQVQRRWGWRGCTSAQAVERLNAVLDYRHEIAHGVRPRPSVTYSYSRDLPSFVLKLARCTDRAVRDHLVSTLGLAHPWPP